VRPVLVIEQEPSLEGLGLLGERLDASGLPYRRFRAWKEGLDGLQARDVAGVIAMGGNAHAWQEDEVPFLRMERLLLADAVETDVPVLGICLGGQLLARAFGADVHAAPASEIGWLDLHPTEEAAGDPLFGHLTGPTGVYQWHHDVFDLPAGARLLARSDLCENQAFRVGDAAAWGIQFHPEADLDLFETWIARNRRYVREAGIDENALRTDVRRGAGMSRPFRARLFDSFLDVVRARWRD
jgi:GMP synthase (glutamine-hydrolysing)